MRICGLADFQMYKMRMVLRIFLRTWWVKCGYRRNITRWKNTRRCTFRWNLHSRHNITCYVRHKTSHRRKSQVNGGHVPQNLYWGDDSDVRPPEFSTYNVLNNALCHLFILICPGLMYYIAFNTGSVWSSHLEWLPEYRIFRSISRDFFSKISG